MTGKGSSVGIALIAVVLHLQTAAGGGTFEGQLLTDFQKKEYNLHEAPANVSVQIGITYLCAIFDETSHVLTSKVFERYRWQDKRLSWDPAKYGGTETLLINANSIWKPDMRLFNSAADFEERDEINAIVHHCGRVYWLPLATYKTFCRDKDGGKEDTYQCRLGLGPWTYDASSLSMQLATPAFDKDSNFYYDECPYTVGQHSSYIVKIKHDCCTELWESLRITFDIHKHGEEDKEDEEGERKKEKNTQHGETKSCRWPFC